MLHKTITATLMIVFLLVSTAAATGLEVAIGGWQQSLGGTLSYQALSTADTIDLDSDLDFDEETVLFGRLKIETPAFLPNIYLVGAPAEFEGAGRRSITLKFGDTTFNADADLTSKITANQYDIGFYYGLPFIETGTAGKLNVDVGLNVRIVDLEATVSGLSGTTLVEENEELTVPVPMLYLAVRVIPVKSLVIEAEGRGVSIGDNHFYSLTGRLRYQFSGPVFIAGGYRYDKLEVDEDDVVADVDFSGPFAEFGLKF